MTGPPLPPDNSCCGTGFYRMHGVGAWRCTGCDEPAYANPVTNPHHYTSRTVECIEVTSQFNFCLGNVIKYVWRCDEKGNPIQDLKKARFYLDKEIERREKAS